MATIICISLGYNLSYLCMYMVVISSGRLDDSVMLSVGYSYDYDCCIVLCLLESPESR